MTTTHTNINPEKTTLPKLNLAPFYCFLVLAHHFNLLNIKNSQIQDLEYVLKHKEFDSDKKVLKQLHKSPMFVTWEEKTQITHTNYVGVLGLFQS